MQTSPIRILHLISDLEIGGAERQLSALVRHSDANRLRHSVVSLTSEGAYGPEIRAAGIPVYALGARRGRVSPRAFIRLAQLFRRERPDLVQTWLYHADLAGILAAAFAGNPPVVWNLRCSDMELDRYAPLTRRVVGVLARLSRRPIGIVANSSAAFDVHERLGYRPRLRCLIANGIDIELFKPNPASRARLRQELGIGPEEVLIGCVARYDPMKDHRTLLAAFSRLTWPARLVLVGRDMVEANSSLANEIREAGLERTRFLLLGERRDVASLLSAFDVFVLASAFGEGFPNAVAEAMACGLPIIATDVGDTAMIVGECGIIVPPRQPGLLTEALGRVIGMPREERQRLGARARDTIAARYSLAAMVDAYAGLYANLAGQAPQ